MSDISPEPSRRSGLAGRLAAALLVALLTGAAPTGLPAPAAGAVPAGAVPAGAVPTGAVLAGQQPFPRPLPAPGFDGPVYATALAGGTVYIGGEFTQATVDGQRFPRAGLAAVDARTGALLDWAPATDGRVTALASDGLDVFAAGSFGRVDGVRRDSLVRLDGRTGAVRPGWAYRITGTPAALGTGHGRLYLGGSLTELDGRPVAAVVAFHLATGAVDTGWAAAADEVVEALAVAPDRVYLAGRFRKVNGVRGSQRLAAVHPQTGALDPGFRAQAATERAHGVVAAPEGVYAAHGGLGGRVRAYDTTGRTRWELTMDGDPATATLLGDAVYFGGHFDSVCRTARVGAQGTCLDGSEPRGKLAAAGRQDGGLLPWRADGNGVAGVRALAADPARFGLAAGGDFTTVAGQPQRRFARFGELP